MKKPVPFDFVLEKLAPLEPVVKPMFGCHAIYTRGKIVLILRKKENETEDNGVWVSSSPEYHPDLKKILPPLRPLFLFSTSGWMNIPEEATDFEECVMEVCHLILKNDFRIGKVTKPKRKKIPRN